VRRRPGARSAAAPSSRRCAVYTRVSTDHGLEQDFNSLDAQHEACVAYVRSQAHEGWVLAHGEYDDGGFSGASLDRPALQALLEAVRQRRIDVIVVYKVDRLTRSLADFAKLVELFDAHGVSFISITQSFNTTTSMGRLTLNMLLSFAQFEREVTGERIRDKIAASKKKGLWVGGVVPLGYKVVDRKLMIDEAEAPIVRLIFELYCALGSMIAVMRELRGRGVVTRTRTLSSGRTIGGIAFTKGPLAYLLKNRMYLGEINHGQTSYPGEHPALIDRTVFESAREILARNAAASGHSQSRSQALLVGRLFDDLGHRMTPSFAAKRGVRYRYYVSRAVTEGRHDLAGSIVRVPAVDVERAVLDTLYKLASTVDPKGWSSLLDRRPQHPNGLNDFSTIALRDAPTQADFSTRAIESSPSTVAEAPGSATTRCVSTASRSALTRASARTASAPSPAMALASESRRVIEAAVERVDIRDGSIEIALTQEATAIVGEAAVVIAWRKSPRRVSRELIPPIEGVHPDARATRSDTKAKLLAGIAKARGWLDDLIAGRVLHIANIAQREKRSVRSTAMLLSLAFLAPALVQAIAENRLPRGIGLTRLSDLPSGWSEQFRALGLQAPR
jgi:DNA invertase Pin-like site-specific DNA recombinase